MKTVLGCVVVVTKPQGTRVIRYIYVVPSIKSELAGYLRSVIDSIGTEQPIEVKAGNGEVARIFRSIGFEGEGLLRFTTPIGGIWEWWNGDKVETSYHGMNPNVVRNTVLPFMIARNMSTPKDYFGHLSYGDTSPFCLYSHVECESDPNHTPELPNRRYYIPARTVKTIRLEQCTGKFIHALLSNLPLFTTTNELTRTIQWEALIHTEDNRKPRPFIAKDKIRLQKLTSLVIVDSRDILKIKNADERTLFTQQHELFLYHFRMPSTLMNVHVSGYSGYFLHNMLNNMREPVGITVCFCERSC